MSSINGLGSMNTMAMPHGMQRRPDPAKMAENLFSKLDSNSQGYLQKSDFEAAFSSMGTTTDTATNVDALFTQLDGDSDGKVTKQEFSDSLTKLTDQLDQQFQSMRMQQAMGGQGGPGGAGGPGGMGGMPPPPPPANDEGFTEDELTSQLEEISSTDSKRSDLISTILENFEAADTDGNGKVSFQEAMAYDQANASSQTENGSTTGTSSAAQTASNDLEGQVMLQIMRLIQAYGIDEERGQASGTLSVVA